MRCVTSPEMDHTSPQPSPYRRGSASRRIIGGTGVLPPEGFCRHPLAASLSAAWSAPTIPAPPSKRRSPSKKAATPRGLRRLVASRKGWRPAARYDGAERGDWWRVFRDPTLDRLIRLVGCRQPSCASRWRPRAGARLRGPGPSGPVSPVIGAPSITARGRRHRAHHVSLQGQPPGNSTCSGASAQHRERGSRPPGSAADLALVR